MSEPPSSSEEALESFLERRRRGERADPAAYAAAHADLGPDLAEALDALTALERATEERDAELPEKIGAFRVVREIGRGGMGVVLEAIEVPLDRRVALKMLPPELLPSGSARARFRREAELAARLHHPGIATIYGAGVEADRPWIAMRYVEGRTLARAIEEARHAEVRCARLGTSPIGEREAALAVASCLGKVARALHSAHEQGVVHRDVKPSNVIVTPDGTPILLDFGLAIAEESDGRSLTRTGETAGTPAYLAPENVSGELARPDAKSDVYALGVTLFECLTLRRPFDAPTPAALYRAIVSGATPDVRAANREVPRDLAVVVATALERDRALRYRSAAALAEDLERCVAGRPIAARPVPLVGRVMRWARREPRQAVLASLLVIATLASASIGGTWWASRDEVHAAEQSSRAQALETAVGDGFSMLSSGDLVEAEADFQRALALDPRCVEALVGRVILGLDRQPISELRARLARVPADTRGLDALQALVEQRPLVPPREGPGLEGATALELCIRGLCWQYQANRTPLAERAPLQEQSLACFTEAILRAPIARQLYYEHRALAAQLAGNARTARSAATALLELWPDSPRALYAAGRALCAFDPPAARRHLERSIELRPRSLAPYNMLAVTCCAQGDYEAAENWCWRALAIDPGNANMHFWVGESLMQRDCQTEAGAAFVRAAFLDPTHTGIWAQFALHQMVAGHFADAVRSYEHSLALDPKNHRARIYYGAALELAGDASGAQTEVDTAIAGLFPFEVDLWRRFSAALEQLGAHMAMLSTAEAGLSLAPGDAELGALRQRALESIETRR